MRKLMILTVGLLGLVLACSAHKTEIKAKQVFVVTKQDNNSAQLRVYIDLRILVSRMGLFDARKILVTDLNNDSQVKHQLIVGNGAPEGIFFVTGFDKSEPVRTFCVSIQYVATKEVDPANDIPPHDSLNINFLTPAALYIAKHGDPAKWTEAIAQSIITTYPNPADLEIFSKGKWSYTNGLFLNALSEIQEKTKNPEYFKYIKAWVDLFVTESGQLNPAKYEREIYELDNIPPGRLLIYLYQQTKDERYRKAAEELIDQLNHQPRTTDGGYWHKKVYTNQMWLDGIYMADVYLAQYASAYKEPKYFDEAVKQIELIYRHTLDSKTGLLYHGWDESKSLRWANPQTGASPEFWGRAIGWYMMALVDVLDYLPANHPERNNILKIFRNLSSSLANYQDTTGMWFQVVDKGKVPGNWLESSCTAMFAYAYAKGVQKGFLETGYTQKALKAFNGLVNHEVYFDDQGKVYLNGTVKVGTLNPKVSDGSYNYYIGVDRRINDFKGVGAFLYLALALGK